MLAANTGIATLATLIIIFVVPFLVYAGFSAMGWVEPPKGPPAAFLASVLVSKAGTAIGFVAIFAMARSDMSGNWLTYAAVWWLMFVIGELGQMIGPDYTWREALAGALSETIYFPAAAWVVNRLIGA